MVDLISVLVYLFCGLSPFIAFFFFRPIFDNNKKVFYGICYLPTSVFAFLRGAGVGTDTENYRDAYEIFDASAIPDFSVDYFFNLLMYVTKVVGFDFSGFSIVHSSLCLVLYTIAAARIDRVSPVFGLGLLPVLFIDSTFNGLRYGLGFAVAALVVPLYFQWKLPLKAFLVLVPALFHSSLLALIPLSTFVLICGLFFIGLFLQADFFYLVFLMNKLEVYSDFSRPSGVSGLMPLMSFSIFYLVYIKNKKVAIPKDRLAIIAIGIFFVGFGIAMVSYAGLRILQIGVLFMAIAASLAVMPENRRLSTQLAMLIGLLSLLNFYRQVFIVGPEGEVYFHPYVFL